jgi:hypothetical protein
MDNPLITRSVHNPLLISIKWISGSTGLIPFLIGSHQLSFGEAMSVHRFEQFLFRETGLEFELRVECVELEKVAVRFAGRRTRPAIADALVVVQALLCTVGQLRRYCHAFSQTGGVRRQIVNHPMHPGAHRRIGVVANQREAFRGGRHARPLQRGRKVLFIERMTRGNRLAFGE